jgi:large subunit ribosomal protein L29
VQAGGTFRVYSLIEIDMKKREFYKEISSLSEDDLRAKERELAQELFKLRFGQSVGQLQQTHLLRELRQKIAQVQTVLSQRTASVSA